MRSLIKFKKVWRYIIVIVLPLAIALYLYPLSKKEIFNSKDYSRFDFKIEDIINLQKKPSLRNLLADIFSIPLSLDWYKVSIINQTRLTDPSCLDEEPSTLFIHFLKGDPGLFDHNLKETTEETGGYQQENPGHPFYYLETGEVGFFIAPSWIDYSIDGGLTFGGDCNLRLNEDFTVGDFYFDVVITIKPYWKAWVIRLGVLYLLWIVLLSSLVAVKEWLKEK